ncbi:hypothetical protein DV454_000270 [Geotrichum candidum]|nr:hypothetical protein DV454_000270 [Geotrichum candidum]
MKFTVVASVAAAAAVASAQYNSTVTAHPTNTHVATSVVTKTITSCSDNKCHAVPTVVSAGNSTVKPTGNVTVSTGQAKPSTGAAAHVAGSMLGAVAVGAVALLI